MKMQGKVALVTGASRGIGRFIAERLGEEGASVVVNHYPSPSDRADATVVVSGIKEKGGAAIAVEGDVADAAQLINLFDVTEEHFGGLDIVVSNAAIHRGGSLAETSDEDFDALFSTNTRTGFRILRESARRVRNGGRVVVISAGLTLMPRPNTGPYGASKAAVDHMVQVAANELGHRDITVNSVLPGPVLTVASVMTQDYLDEEISRTPLGRIGTEEDITDIVAFLASEEGRWVTGQRIGAGGGMF